MAKGIPLTQQEREEFLSAIQALPLSDQHRAINKATIGKRPLTAKEQEVVDQHSQHFRALRLRMGYRLAAGGVWVKG